MLLINIERFFYVFYQQNSLRMKEKNKQIVLIKKYKQRKAKQRKGESNFSFLFLFFLLFHKVNFKQIIQLSVVNKQDNCFNNIQISYKEK
jgi:hypothetical protein